MSNLDSFREETRQWLEQNAPPAFLGRGGGGELEGPWGGRRWKFSSDAEKQWLDVMGERGWTAPTWPSEYGGGGLSPAEAKVLAQLLRELKLPRPLIGFGLTMIGPTLLQFGNEEQKRLHLPRIVRGEIRWCQGYSEPNAGSDLASLQARGVVDGDHMTVSGTKVWTSYADECDWIFALVRTKPEATKKQDGISFVLIDMEDPGVSVKPIKLISGSSPFCETHFTDVKVPLANVVNGLHNGWTVAKALLGHERSMIADAFGGVVSSDRARGGGLQDMARRYLGGGDGPLEDAVTRDAIAQVEMDTRAFTLTVQRTRDAAKAGHKPGPESSIFKLYGTELNKRRYELQIKIAGPQSLGWEGPGYEDAELQRTRDWLRSRGNSIEGGTSEIQLNVIAKRVLGLPD